MCKCCHSKGNDRDWADGIEDIRHSPAHLESDGTPIRVHCLENFSDLESFSDLYKQMQIVQLILTTGAYCNAEDD